VVSKKFPVYLKSVGSLVRDEHSFPIRRQNIRSISSITIFLLLIEVGSLKSSASTSFSFIVVPSPSCWHSPSKCRPSFTPHSFCFLSTSRNPARTCFTPRRFSFHGTHSCATMHHVLSFFITSRADRIGEAQTKACSSLPPPSRCLISGSYSWVPRPLLCHLLLLQHTELSLRFKLQETGWN
jgi:hypothetical protein